MKDRIRTIENKLCLPSAPGTSPAAENFIGSSSKQIQRANPQPPAAIIDDLLSEPVLINVNQSIDADHAVAIGSSQLESDETVAIQRTKKQVYTIN